MTHTVARSPALRALLPAIDRAPASAAQHVEHIAPSVTELMQRVFPGTSGTDLLGGIRRHACVKQLALPDLDSFDVAVVSMPSLAAFATSLCWGKDKLLRHLATAEALHVLWRSRSRDASTLYFPLAPYQHDPQATLPALDQLIEKGREKQRQLARGVKERYLLYYGLPFAEVLPARERDLVTLLLELQEELAAKRRNPLRIQVLQMKITIALARLGYGDRAAPGRLGRGIVVAEGGDLFSWPTEVSLFAPKSAAPTHSSRDVHQHEGDQRSRSSRRVLSLSPQEGDLEAARTDKHAEVRDVGPLSATHQGDFEQQEGDFHAPRSDQHAQVGDVHAFSSTHKGDVRGQEGDFQERLTRPRTHKKDLARRSPRHQGDLEQQEGDFHATRSDQHAEVRVFPPVSSIYQGDFEQQEGDFHQHPTHPHAYKEDLAAQRPRQRGDLSQQEGDFHAAHAAIPTSRGDFEQQEGDFHDDGTSLSINDNGNNYNDSKKDDDDSDIDSAAPTSTNPSKETAPKRTTQNILREAKALAMFLENTPRNTGSFVTRLRADPRAVRAAVIDVLVHTHFPDYRGKPRNRGAWFNTAYAAHAQPHAPIPAEIGRWLDTVLSWMEIDLALAKEAAVQGRQQIPPPEERRQDAPTARETSGVSPPARAPDGEAKTWMDQTEAEALARQITEDGVTHGYPITARAVPDQGVWIVRVNWKGHHGFPMRSTQAWTKHFTAVQSLALQQHFKQEQEARHTGNSPQSST